MDEAVKSQSAVDPELRKKMANAIRVLSMDAVQKANSGHPGAPMGLADVATVLFTEHLKYDAAHPDYICKIPASAKARRWHHSCDPA